MSFLRLNGKNKEEGVFLWPSSEILSLLEMKRIYPWYLLNQGWYEKEEFAHSNGKNGKIFPQLVSVLPKPGSFGRPWKEQKALLSFFETVPEVHILISVLISFRIFFGHFPSEGIYLRTASVRRETAHLPIPSRGSNRVMVGCFRGKLRVCFCDDEGGKANIGIAFSRTTLSSLF